MTNFENLAYLINKDVQEILVKEDTTNTIYLAHISCTGNSVELYHINDDSGLGDLIVSIKDFDEHFSFL